MKKKPLIIFDMDGVLVDVSGSYREVVRLSVVYYLRYVIGAKDLKDEFIDLTDVSVIKKSGGLNNDWDLTYTILDALLYSLFHAGNEKIEKTFIGLLEIKDDEELLKSVSEYHKDFDKSGIIQNLNPKDSSLNKTVSELFFESKPSIKSHSPFLLNRGDVGTGNLAKRIFQELYLGGKMFTELTEMKPLFYKGIGYIDRETLIPLKSQLHMLAGKNVLSIATGRPGVEALHALGHFKISDLFAAVVTEDDIVEAEKRGEKHLRKPDPFTLNLCVERSGLRGSERNMEIYYIGDMPDDMSAAVNAGITPVGFVNERVVAGDGEASEHRDLLKEKGAVKVFGSFFELVDFFKS
jgi:phosphoglycolate phosphatase-like HAD superfamily hydrolase